MNPDPVRIRIRNTERSGEGELTNTTLFSSRFFNYSSFSLPRLSPLFIISFFLEMNREIYLDFLDVLVLIILCNSIVDYLAMVLQILET